MSRKDYETVARAIRSVSEIVTSPTACAVVEAIVSRIANEFEAENPNFDRERFRVAAIVTHEDDAPNPISSEHDRGYGYVEPLSYE